MKVLALDYGSARTGVAVSDPTGTVARPLEVVQRAATEAGLARVLELAAAEDVERIVVGLPITLRGERGRQAEETERFVERLRDATDLPVESFDERYHDGARAPGRGDTRGGGRRRRRPPAHVLPAVEGERPPRVRTDYRKRRGGRIAALLGVVVGFGLAATIAWAVLGTGVGGGGASEVESSTGLVDTAPPKPILRIVFPEGFTRKEMARRITAVNEIAEEERGISPSLRPKAYLQATEDVQGLPAGFKNDDPPNLEGFLFPATYDFTEDTTSKQLVDAQLEAFERAWSEVDLEYARSKNLTPYDVLIIASMIEKEVQVPRERALVSAVIYNRLRAGMPLGIDATIRYGYDIPPTQAILESQLEADHPYNTRKRVGLTPTPISNPGLASLQAAAHPAEVDFVYFVRKADCKSHFFTASEEEFVNYSREGTQC